MTATLYYYTNNNTMMNTSPTPITDFTTASHGLPPAILTTAPVLTTSSSQQLHTEEATPQTPRPEQKPRRVSFTKNQNKRVGFASTITLVPAASPLDQLDDTDTGAAIWYTVADLASFRQEARDLCRHLRDADGVVTEQAPAQTQQQPRMASCAQTRGLESRTCLERQRRKYLAVKCVVRAQHKLQDSERLAALGERCTRWAADLARREAALDFVRAYQEEYHIAVAQRCNGKRQLNNGVTAETPRAVRQRLC